MNYYYPYGTMPYIQNTSNIGLLSRIFKNGINWGSILSNAQKTLNVVNQTIPVVKQIGPVVNNAKTMFKVMNEFKKVDSKPEITNKPKKIENNTKENTKKIESSNNNPTFFQ